MSQPLTDQEKAMLEFEHLRWAYAGARETAIREQFGMSMVRYAQVLNVLIERPEALAHDAQVVRRLQRIRDARRAQRTPRPIAG